MDINHQIANLRRTRGITQEELATALGVTNQAVSKWESGQCCPDIQLLPPLASYFHVSVDDLLGLDTPRQDTEPGAADSDLPPSDPVSAMIRIISEASVAESDGRVLDAALAMHAALFYKRQSAVPTTGSAVEAVLGGQWGYSAISEPDMTTVMRGQSVFYSRNTALDLDRNRIHTISLLLRTLGKENNLTALSALYELTVHAEGAYVSLSDISEKCAMTQESLMACFDGELFPYICERNGSYRIRGEAMAILPVLSILCY